MSYHQCISGSGRLLAPQDGNYHCLTCLEIKHAEEAFVDGSCYSCEDMIISELHSRLRYVKHGGVSLPLPCPLESEVIWGSQWRLPQEEFLTLQALRSWWGCHWSELGLCRTGYTTCFLWCSPWRSVFGRVPNCFGLSIAGSTPCLEPPQRAPSGQGQSDTIVIFGWTIPLMHTISHTVAAFLTRDASIRYSGSVSAPIQSFSVDQTRPIQMRCCVYTILCCC